jgi:DNA polymerase-3 subunit chi
MEIFFYHLEQAPLERALPQLLEKTLERGWKAVVEIGSNERLDSLDATLWTYRDDSFLPHGMEGSEFDTDQPILLTTAPENTNNAQIRFFVDRAVPSDDVVYERLVFMFDGHDPEAVEEARGAWKALSVENECTYWQQEPGGRWTKKA